MAMAYIFSAQSWLLNFGCLIRVEGKSPEYA